jgi:hypothetical protein
MKTAFILWRNIRISVAHGEAPKNRELYRFAIKTVTPAKVHLPLPTSRYGHYHYVSKSEVAEHSSFRAYLIARLERDAPAGLIQRNAQVLRAARQLQLDFTPKEESR